MISSVVVKKEMEYISFIKIEMNLLTNDMNTKIANYELTDELRNHVTEKHRVYLPCNINIAEDTDRLESAILYVPYFWDTEMVENYTQALMDEIYLNRYKMQGCKTIKQIEQSFMLEVVLL